MTKTELATAVLEARSACQEFKAAAQAYLDAVGTDNETNAGKTLLAEAKEDINTIDDTIAFLGSDFAKEMLGAETAAAMLAQSKEAKAAGAVYCTCPGCAAAEAILKHENLF